jgi:uncharacterized protein
MVMQLLRIFVDDAQRYEDRALYLALVDELHRAGFPGATVFKGIEGYGHDKTIYAARQFEVSTGLPVLIEVIDEEGKIRAFLPKLQAMIDSGLLTLEKIEAIRISKDATE